MTNERPIAPHEPEYQFMSARSHYPGFLSQRKCWIQTIQNEITIFEYSMEKDNFKQPACLFSVNARQPSRIILGIILQRVRGLTSFLFKQDYPIFVKIFNILLHFRGHHPLYVHGCRQREDVFEPSCLRTKTSKY